MWYNVHMNTHTKIACLHKIAKDDESFIDRHPWLTSAMSGAAGTKIVSDPRVVSRATGTEHLFHATGRDNVPGIREKGLQVARSFDRDNITHIVFPHNAKKISEGRVFTGRTKTAPRIMKMWINKFSKKGPADILDIRIPYDKINELGPGIDPSHILNGKRGTFDKIMSNIFGFGPMGTMTFDRDIPPEYISGSSKFKHGIISELKGIPAYAKKHPTRFIKGVGGLGIGAGLIGLSANSAVRGLKNARKTSKLSKMLRSA
jgi:hypothetical protein